MAGTPEKILEHLLEAMRLDATFYDPMGEHQAALGGGETHMLSWGP